MDLPDIPRTLLARRRVPELAMFNWPRPVRLGVLDENARYVYTHGQCGALAIGLWDLFGWPIRAVWCQDSSAPDHLVVQLPDDRVLDINGTHRTDYLLDRYDGWCDQGTHELVPVTAAQILLDWQDDAMPHQDLQAGWVFAAAVAQRYAGVFSKERSAA